MKHTFDRCFKFKVGDESWEAYLITLEEMIELNSDDDDIEVDEETKGFVDFKDKCFFIQEGCVNKGTIRHELLHVYINQHNLESADVTVDQLEEIIATFFERHHDKYVKKVNQLYKKYKAFEGAQ